MEFNLRAALPTGVRPRMLNIFIAAALAACLLAAFPSFAAEAVKTDALPIARNQEEIPGKVAQATLTKKTRQVVWAGTKPFVVSSGTRIISETGLYLSLGEVALPCEALIRFEQDVNSQAVKIEIRKTYPGASRRWSAELPE